MAAMITIYESAESAAGILQRRIMSTVEDVPEVVLASIQRVFGEALTPEAAVARLLADNGADINTTDKNDDTPLTLAASNMGSHPSQDSRSSASGRLK